MYFDLPKPKKWQEKWGINAEQKIGKNEYDGIHLYLSKMLIENDFEKLRAIRKIIGEHTQLIVFTVDNPKHLNALYLLSPTYRPNHIITNCVQHAQQQQQQQQQRELEAILLSIQSEKHR